MKKLNKKGFTLAELLIVVAIVGVLVAISIPIFSGKLLKAKIATNQANIRAAKAAAVADYLTEGKSGTETAQKYLYDVQNGTVAVETTTKAKAKEAKNDIYPEILVTINGDQVETSPKETDVENPKCIEGTNGAFTR